MKEDRRFIDNAQSLKPFLSKVQKLGKKTAKKTSLIDQEWERITPKDRLPFTSIIGFRNNILTVGVSHSALLSEMEINKQTILTNLNSGNIIFVRDIVFKIN